MGEPAGGRWEWVVEETGGEIWMRGLRCAALDSKQFPGMTREGALPLPSHEDCGGGGLMTSCPALAALLQRKPALVPVVAPWSASEASMGP